MKAEKSVLSIKNHDIEIALFCAFIIQDDISTCVWGRNSAKGILGRLGVVVIYKRRHSLEFGGEVVKSPTYIYKFLGFSENKVQQKTSVKKFNAKVVTQPCCQAGVRTSRLLLNKLASDRLSPSKDNVAQKRSILNACFPKKATAGTRNRDLGTTPTIGIETKILTFKANE